MRNELKNSSWLAIENITKLIGGLLIGITIAREMGPVNYGKFTYVMLIIGIVSIVSRLGIDSILVREITKNRSESKKYIATAFNLITLSTIIISILVFLVLTAYESAEIIDYYSYLAIGLIFQSFIVYDLLYLSELESKKSAKVRIYASIISTTIKLLVLFNEKDIIYLFYVYAFDNLLVAIFLFIGDARTKKIIFR